MTLVVLHYPAVLALFGLSLLASFGTWRGGVRFLLSGLLASATVLAALIFSIPLVEILLMLGLLLLAGFLGGGKEEQP